MQERQTMITQFMFIVAISPLMFSPGIDGGELKSMRLAGGVFAGPLIVDSPEALFRLVGGEREMAFRSTLTI